MEKYTRISCEFYDVLEAIATKKQKIRLKFTNEEKETIERESLIKDFQTKDKAEFLFLDDGTKVRLDRIETINILA